ncbi:hypothetical protein WA158_007882 [Blastocystis sp. Blastoise]
MAKYSATPVDTKKSCMARGSYLRVHYKPCQAVAKAIMGKSLLDAKKYLQDVIAHKSAVAFTQHNGGIGRHAQGKNLKSGSQCAWPEKACRFFLVLLDNLQANGEAKELDAAKLYISHSQANHAPCGHRRTYRAHGRIGPIHPAHIEVIASEKAETVARGGLN